MLMVSAVPQGLSPTAQKALWTSPWRAAFDTEVVRLLALLPADVQQTPDAQRMMSGSAIALAV
jgi:hypothetical protein